MQINPAEFKLLVVDDVQTNVLLLKALLGKEGYGILVANNGQEALEVIRNENPDLISNRKSSGVRFLLFF